MIKYRRFQFAEDSAENRSTLFWPKRVLHPLHIPLRRLHMQLRHNLTFILSFLLVLQAMPSDEPPKEDPIDKAVPPPWPYPLGTDPSMDHGKGEKIGIYPMDEKTGINANNEKTSGYPAKAAPPSLPRGPHGVRQISAAQKAVAQLQMVQTFGYNTSLVPPEEPHTSRAGVTRLGNQRETYWQCDWCQEKVIAMKRVGSMAWIPVYFMLTPCRNTESPPMPNARKGPRKVRDTQCPTPRYPWADQHCPRPDVVVVDRNRTAGAPGSIRDACDNVPPTPPQRRRDTRRVKYEKNETVIKNEMSACGPATSSASTPTRSFTMVENSDVMEAMPGDEALAEMIALQQRFDVIARNQGMSSDDAAALARHPPSE